MNKIYKKLLNIQTKLKGLSKDQKSYGYDYVSGSKLLSFIRPLMDEEGLILKQEVLSIENVRQDYQTSKGGKSEILSKVMMRFTWIDCETGEKDENLFGANGQNDWEKGLGSALTYAERYFLLKFFHIATDEDDIDNSLRKKEDTTPSKEPTQAAKKPWLNKGTEDYDKVIAAIQSKQCTSVDMVRKKFAVSKELASELELEINAQ